MTWENKVSGSTADSVTQIGTVHGNVNIGSSPEVRSGYLAQVRSIAPAELVGREDELAALADFCTSPDSRGQYAWWRADAWSGKSALLSSFVLRPPPGVRIVSFFVSGNLAGQGDRHALVDNLLEQLLILLGKPAPPLLTEATHEGHALALLSEAADWCAKRDEQFVLIVDGLDEDLGFDATADTHSIAAFLPRVLPAGMRVIVAGRPSPPIPYDVRDDHPLRDPAIARPLPPSPEATALREVMVRDLKRLYGGTPVERALLGLVTAAGGGLATADLASLTGTAESDVEDALSTAAGRSFVRRPGRRAGRSPDVHLLAHEELQRLAERMYGRTLDEHREKIHAWADAHRDGHWPEDTPEYLLSGYFAMLTASRDTARMFLCATDPHRRHRLRTATGGDSAGLAEITATQDVLLADEHPDLVTLTRLSVHRSDLFGHTGRLPLLLPTGWSALGDLERAMSMIEAFEEPHDRIDALLSSSRAIRRAGRTSEADDLLDRAEKLALPLDQFYTARPLRSVAEEFARIGDYDRAETDAAHVHETERAVALASLATRAAEREDRERATAYLEDVETRLVSSDQASRVAVLARTALAAAKLGDRARATALLDETERALDPDDYYGVIDVPATAEVSAEIGDCDRALRIAARIEDTASRERTLLSIIGLTTDHDPDRAEAIARSTTQPAVLGTRLALVASRTADRRQADRLITEVEQTADRMSGQERRGEVLLALAVALADTGDLDRGEEIARRHAVADGDADSLILVGAAAARAGEPARAAELLVSAEEVARATPGPDEEKLAVLWISTMADRGDLDRAAADARSIRDPLARSAAWAAVAHGALNADLIELGASAVSSIENEAMERRPRLELVRVVLAAGDIDRAERIARDAADPAHLVTALTAVAEAARKGELLDEAEVIVDSALDPSDRMDALATLTEIAARIGDRERMYRLLDRLRSAAKESATYERRPRNVMADPLLRTKPSRLRGYTEVLEIIARMRFPNILTARDDHRTVAPVESPYKQRTRGLSQEHTLAQRLSTTDWRYVVEELVEFRPATYHAIVEELKILFTGRNNRGI